MPNVGEEIRNAHECSRGETKSKLIDGEKIP